MKVQFEFSASDLAEVANRTTDRSRVVQRWRMEGLLIWAVVVGLLVYAITPGQPSTRAALAVIFCVILVVVISRLNGRSSRDSRMLRYYREQLGGDGPFLCEVELSPAGLITRQLGAETIHSWSHVTSITEVTGGIEFIYRPTGTLLVRERAFQTPEARQEFLALARRFVPAGDAI